VAELEEALQLLEQSDAKGLLITSAKSVFIAGADITEFGPVFTLPADEMKVFFNRNNNNLNRLESLPFPSVVAINGFALGGGFEVCLAADYRVMSTSAKVGLPETGLGIIPGWGGTVRMPRIAGLETAMTWVATAKHQRSDAALSVGLADQIVDDELLRGAALKQLEDAIEDGAEYLARRKEKTSPMSIDASQAQQIGQAAKAEICRRSPQLKAPAAAIELMANCTQLDRTAALSAESDLFAELANSDQCRALVGNFMNDQYIKRLSKKQAKQSQLTLDKATVVGAGIMGGGIAYQNALSGIPVVMKDIAEQALDLGMSEADKLLGKKVRQGRMSDEQKAATLANIHPSLEMSDVNGSKVIVEAVVENPKVKTAVLAELENELSDDGILTSNTSTISITRLAQALKEPERFAGLHFFNPVHAMPLVEVIRGEKTSDQTTSDLVAYSLALGKQPIVVNDCPGFLVNRVLFPYFMGFEMLVRDGADFHKIDDVMHQWGWPMGPAYLGDVIGIDTICHCMDVLASDFPDRMALINNSVSQKMAAAGRFGQKNGKGFFQYVTDEKGRPSKEIDSDANALVDSCREGNETFTDEQIVMRCMLPMAIEMARCIEEGIVASPAEADMALLMGLGFPPFRGGILRWMDEIGAETLCQWSEQLAHLGEAYVATPGMQAMASSGGRYYTV
jgi:3-hydroxyacyl-CoA dehydrogenase / enoyl-CoA hydratase / 3-hydroxybutyryl-CoA epimerase / enoyl-CoA isomerase